MSYANSNSFKFLLSTYSRHHLPSMYPYKKTRSHSTCSHATRFAPQISFNRRRTIREQVSMDITCRLKCSINVPVMPFLHAASSKLHDTL